MVFAIHWHESAMDLHVFPIPIPPPTSFSTRFLWVFPVHQDWALVSCIPPGLVICFTIDNIHVSMLFSWNIPPLPSPTGLLSFTCIFNSFLITVPPNLPSVFPFPTDGHFKEFDVIKYVTIFEKYNRNVLIYVSSIVNNRPHSVILFIHSVLFFKMVLYVPIHCY